MTNKLPTRRPPRMIGVGRFFGVPIYFAPSWLVIAAILTLTYAPVIQHAIPRASASSAYGLSFVFALAFALCVLAHELGHTAVSLALGMPVRRVVIFLLGGVSEIERDPQRARDEFLVAGAGPAVSVLLAAAAGAGARVVNHATMPGVVLELLFWSNLTVAVFNLLPGLPLDGGRLLRAAVWGSGMSRLAGTKAAVWVGRALAVAVALTGLLLDRSALGLTSGLLSFAVGAYLWFGAQQALRAGVMLDRVPSIALDDLLRPGLLVPGDLSVAEALRRAWDRNARGLVVVDNAQRPRAIVDEALIGAVPPARRPWVPVGEVSHPITPGMVLTVGTDGPELVDAVRSAPAPEYLVVDRAGAPAGILAAADLVAALRGTA